MERNLNDGNGRFEDIFVDEMDMQINRIGTGGSSFIDAL